MTKTNEESKSSLSINERMVEMEEVNVLLRLYEKFRANRKVKSGIQQFEKFSAPIIEKYHIIVDENIDKVKTKLAYWVSGVNIYNHLTGLWLYQNMPFGDNIVELSAFIQSFEALGKVKNEEKVHELIKSFYNITSNIWKSLKNPSNEEIRNTLLESVALTINKHFNLENENLATGLFQMFKTLIETSREFITEEDFIAKVEAHLGEQVWKKNEFEYVTACKEFYTFAKRFVLIDSPPCQNKNVKRWMINYIKDKAYDLTEISFEKTEKRIDSLIEYFNVSHEPFAQAFSLSKRSERLIQKVQILGLHLYRLGIQRVRSSKFYLTADAYFGIEDKLGNLFTLSAKLYTEVNVRAVNPAIEYVRVNEKLVKDKVEVVFQNLNLELVRTNFINLRKKFGFLKACTAIIRDDILTLVFDREALKELGKNAKEELLHIYKELKSLERARVQVLGTDLYRKALLKFKSIEQRASEPKREAIEERAS